MHLILIKFQKLMTVIRVPTGSRKHGKWLKENPCMEKSWNLKINEKSWNFGRDGFLDVSIIQIFLAHFAPLTILKSLIFQQSNQKPSFLHHKTRIFTLIQLLSVFAIYTALYDKRKVGCYTLNDHGFVMEKSWLFYFLWEPYYVIGLQFCTLFM